jgi:hypothetical protein
MSDVQGSTDAGSAPQPAGAQPTYSGDAAGIREAVTDHWIEHGPGDGETDEQVRNPERPFSTEMIELEDGYDPEKGVSVRKAAEALSRYHDIQRANSEAIDRAMGLDDGEQPEQVEETTAQPPERLTRLEQENQQFRQEVEAVKQQTTAELDRTHQIRQQHLQGLQFASEIIEQEFMRDFPDIRNANDFHALAQTNPQRYIAAHATLTRAQAILTQHAHAAQQADAEVQRHVAAWTAEQDRIFTAKHPDLADPKVGYEVGQRAIKMLESVGVTKPELQALWSGHQDISFRDARTQEILLDALRYRELQDRARNGKGKVSKALPPVQRPGVGRQQSSGSSELEKAQRAFNENQIIRNAARLQTAMRRAREA